LIFALRIKEEEMNEYTSVQITIYVYNITELFFLSTFYRFSFLFFSLFFYLKGVVSISFMVEKRYK